MAHQLCHLKGLNTDLLADIVARLDGSTLAFTACTCSDLRDFARDQSFWRQLCYSTWPSTALTEAQHLFSSSTIGGFSKFYADSYPLVLYEIPANAPKPCNLPKLKNQVFPSDFASLVDVYYKNKCIFSRVLDGITEAVDVYEENDLGSSWDASTNDLQRWFLNCPFKLDLLNNNHDERIGGDIELGFANDGYDNDHYNNNNGERLAAALTSPSEYGKSQEDRCMELAEDIRLSWVLLDRKKGKAVNLSSWKPMLVKRSWPSDCDYVMHFGCVVPVEEGVLPHKLAKCMIVARCRLTEKQGCPRWREISMRIEDLLGAQIHGGKSLIILNRALYCLRSRNHLKVEKGYSQYERQKRDLMRRKEFKETLADCLCLSIEFAVSVFLCYFFYFSL